MALLTPGRFWSNSTILCHASAHYGLGDNAAWMMGELASSVRQPWPEFPSDGQFAQRLNVSIRSVKIAISQLRRVGLLDVQVYILDREQWVCHYCRKRLVHSRTPGIGKPWAVLDHVVARSRGGPTELANLLPACDSCNSIKGNRPYEWMMARIGHARS